MTKNMILSLVASVVFLFMLYSLYLTMSNIFFIIPTLEFVMLYMLILFKGDNYCQEEKHEI